MLAGVKVIPRDQLHSGPDTSDSDTSKERKKSGSKKGKRERRRNKSLHYYDSSSDGDGSRHHGGRTKHGKERRKKIEDNSRECSSKDDKELERKELGLEWMLNSGKTPTKKSSEVCDDAQEETQSEKVMKSNPNELNPYFKDNGSGFPDDNGHIEGHMDLPLSSSVVGDGGASWRLKALKRAREQAAREGRILDEVVEERWGSLGKLAASVASRRAAPARAHLHAIKDRKKGVTENSETNACDQMKGGIKEAHGRRQDYLKEVSSRHPEMKKPSHSQFLWRNRKGQNISEEDTSLINSAVSRLNKYANDGSFMDGIIHRQCKDADVSTSSSIVDTGKGEPRDAGFDPSKSNDSSAASVVSKQGLNPNQVAAKVLQLRLKGKHEEAEKLLNETATTNSKPDSGAEVIVPNTRETSSRYIGLKLSKERKEEDADVHLAQKIVQNKQYSMSARADDEYDFGDAPNGKRNRKREGVPEEKSNVFKRFVTQQERCQFCFESPSRPKHLVVSIANFTYMMLPQWQPVVQGHCCILPLQHESATRSVDDDVWDEIRNFKKCLIMMFDKQDKGVVFLETVMGLAKQRRHCLVECIPLPREVAKDAPLYFKKAIDEAEDEWSQHNAKKLIDTSNKGLRRSVPKDFPYFHVEFGLNTGFAHVIDDEGKFRSNFGLNVIRGMLQLPEEDMFRKRRHETEETQRQAVADFRREWEPFDWTKQLET